MINLRLIILIVLICLCSLIIKSQEVSEIAEKIRIDYKIPEVGYAVVSADSVLDLRVLGVKKIGSQNKAGLTDRFHLGSNTKAITALIAALLIRENKISWKTKIFDLFPEWKAAANPAYQDIKLQDLLTFRAKLPPYTYTNPLPRKFKGTDAQQRLQLAHWFLRQPPNNTPDELKRTNAGYIIAGLMLERAAGKSYQQLVKDLGTKLQIDFGFDYPNLTDINQPWGHDVNLKPLPPQKSYKLNWLLSAGNINASLPDYAKFIQLQLRGLAGKSELLTKTEFEFLHYGAPEFAAGWFWKLNDHQHAVSSNIGNAGAFITQVYVIRGADRAYILFANAASEKTSEGLELLSAALMKKYGD